MEELCVKCEKETPVVLTATAQRFCRECFLLFCTGKFRSSFGKHCFRTYKRKVLLTYSGGRSSAALLHLCLQAMRAGQHKTTFQLLPIIVYIDESSVLPLKPQQQDEILKQLKHVATETNLPVYSYRLEHVFLRVLEDEDPRISADSAQLPEADEEAAAIMQSKVDSVSSRLSELEDFVVDTRMQLLAKIARHHDVGTIFLGDHCDHLAARFLSHVALCQTSGFSEEMSFSDERFGDVSFVRPLREFQAKDVSLYNQFLGVEFCSIPKPGSMNPLNSSVQRLSETFVNSLQAQDNNTVSKIFRTGEKLKNDNQLVQKRREMEDVAHTEEEDMEQDTPDIEESDEDESDSDSSSDEDESSEYDEEGCEKRRQECNTEMNELEAQFNELREQLYIVRSTEVNAKLEAVRLEDAIEYQQPLQQLREAARIRQEVAEILRGLQMQNIKNRYDAEIQASEQHFQSEKSLLMDSVRDDLEDRIRRLEEDRQNIDLHSDLWNESQLRQKKKPGKRSHAIFPTSPSSFFTTERRRKPVTVAGPYIVYMLHEGDIIDDWTTIRKALKQAEKEGNKPRHGFVNIRQSSDKHGVYTARYEDGRLYYQGSWYNRGTHIVIDNQEDSPVRATVTAINTTEVWVKRADGNKSKLYIAQLQKGKYTISRC